VRTELHPEEDGEFAAQVEYYEEQEPGLGQRFYREVIATLEWIALNAAVPRLRRNYRRLNLRVFPLHVAYFAENDLIWVLAIAHGHRKPGYWAERMKSDWSSRRSSSCLRHECAGLLSLSEQPPHALEFPP